MDVSFPRKGWANISSPTHFLRLLYDYDNSATQPGRVRVTIPIRFLTCPIENLCTKRRAKIPPRRFFPSTCQHISPEFFSRSRTNSKRSKRNSKNWRARGRPWSTKTTNWKRRYDTHSKLLDRNSVWRFNDLDGNFGNGAKFLGRAPKTSPLQLQDNHSALLACCRKIWKKINAGSKFWRAPKRRRR